jgi:Domain of unknown function (DUF4145)
MAINYKLISAQNNPIHIRHPNGHGTINVSTVPNLRCPYCMHMGAFTSVLQHDLRIDHVGTRNGAPFNLGYSTVGVRVCPNPDCRGVVLVVLDSGGGTVALPSEVLDFDPKDILASIVSSMEEAVKCHSARCYKAAALMVRRVLEELCEDQEAVGSNLKERLANLSKTIIVPLPLLQAADHLRLLGNDAAHIEAKTYQLIGEPEIRIAVNLTKELLKATYQYRGLLGQLAALQNQQP